MTRVTQGYPKRQSNGNIVFSTISQSRYRAISDGSTIQGVIKVSVARYSSWPAEVAARPAPEEDDRQDVPINAAVPMLTLLIKWSSPNPLMAGILASVTIQALLDKLSTLRNRSAEQ